MLSNDFGYMLEDLFYMLSNAEMTLESIVGILGLLVSMGQLIFTVVGWGGAILAAILAVVWKVATYVLKAIPVFALARKSGRKLAWLAWIPWYTHEFQTFVLADIPGDKSFQLFNGKLKLQKRWVAFIIWLGITLVAPYLVAAIRTPIVAACNVVPILGTIIGALIGVVLGYVVDAAAGIMKFGFLRDVLNIYKPDVKSNQTTALVIIILDILLTGGWARTILLYTLLKKKPLPVTEVEAEVVA